MPRTSGVTLWTLKSRVPMMRDRAL